MSKASNPGKLCFLGANPEEKLRVYWSVFQGNFDQDSWKASVSFSENFGVPQRAIKLLSSALEDSSIQVLLELENGNKIECVIHSIDDLADSGVVEIASLNLGRTRFILTQ